MEDAREQSGSAFDFDGSLLCTVTEGRLTSLNAAWERVLGWTREELMARPFVEFLHPDDVERTAALDARIATAGSEVVAFENRYRTKDDGWRWLRWNARSDGSTWFAFATDVTEEKAAFEQVLGAVADDRLLAYSQPIADRRTGRIVQEELLVRMLAEEDSRVLSPAAFMPAAERSGAVTTIDLWMTERALKLAERGRNVEVNLSARSINDENMIAEIAERVEAIGVAARRIVFEITETTALANFDAAHELSERLGRLGCQIALDDFGTGFGSLTHLRQLPVQMLKIDMTFIAGLRTNAIDQVLVRGIAGMARELGLLTVAEGVEDPTTYELLGDYGVDRVQGFLIGRPAPLEAVPHRRPIGRPGSRGQAKRRRASRASIP